MPSKNKILFFFCPSHLANFCYCCWALVYNVQSTPLRKDADLQLQFDYSGKSPECDSEQFVINSNNKY